MNFEEALANLKIGKILTRKAWTDIRIHTSNNKIVLFKKYNNNQWEPKQEDILADDWEIVDPDDIKEFHLSVNELKELGVNEEAISELKDKFCSSIKKLVGSKLMNPETEEKIKELLKNPSPPVFNIPKTEIPQFNRNK